MEEKLINLDTCEVILTHPPPIISETAQHRKLAIPEYRVAWLGFPGLARQPVLDPSAVQGVGEPKTRRFHRAAPATVRCEPDGHQSNLACGHISDKPRYSGPNSG